MEGVQWPPNYLIERFKSWRRNRYDDDKAWYQRLAEEGQRPRAMVISCCDSRVDPTTLFTAEPGELFMLRNVANIVPPCKPDHEHHGTSAAIEYAVTALHVAHIVVMGHAHCGGVEAFYDACQTEGEEPAQTGVFIGPWLSTLRPAMEEVREKAEGSRAERLRIMEQRAVVASLRNLTSFPFVREAVDAERLRLHGLWFDIGAGKLFAYQPEQDVFEPMV